MGVIAVITTPTIRAIRSIASSGVSLVAKVMDDRWLRWRRLVEALLAMGSPIRKCLPLARVMIDGWDVCLACTTSHRCIVVVACLGFFSISHCRAAVVLFGSRQDVKASLLP